MQPVTTREFRLTEAQFWHVTRWAVRKIFVRFALVYVALGLALLAMGLSFHPTSPALVCGGFALPLVGMPLQVLFTRWWAVKLHRELVRRGLLEGKLTLHDEGVLIEATPGSRSELGWTTFLEWSEAGGLIMLRIHSQSVLGIPLAAFEEGDLERARQILGAHVKRA